jgi:4-hydroxy-3-methylbut-2-en-1-yl diphosphate synthase IspG/GcpE
MPVQVLQQDPPVVACLGTLPAKPENVRVQELGPRTLRQKTRTLVVFASQHHGRAIRVSIWQGSLSVELFRRQSGGNQMIRSLARAMVFWRVFAFVE